MKKNNSKYQIVILSIVFLVITQSVSSLFSQATLQAFCQEKCARKQQKNFGYNSNVKMNFSDACYLDCISKNSKNYESQGSSNDTGQCTRGDCINGKGILVVRDEYDYVGEFKNGKRHGQGTLTQVNGAKYVGGWSWGQMHGKGILTRDGSEYVGEFKNDKRHGQGTQTFPDGLKYVGEWSEGHLHGHGTLTQPDGSVQKGLFKNGKFIKNEDFVVNETASDSNPVTNSNSGNFTEYQGKMNWKDAKAKCVSGNMRIPTIDELKAAYAAGITDSWRNDGSAYWSSTLKADNIAYFLNILDGYIGSYYFADSLDVRCIRSGALREESIRESKTKFGVVTAKGGLFLRQDCKQNSKKVILMPENAEMEIMEEKNEEEIDSLRASWYLIKYKTNTGCSFGGYIKIKE